MTLIKLLISEYNKKIQFFNDTVYFTVLNAAKLEGKFLEPLNIVSQSKSFKNIAKVKKFFLIKTLFSCNLKQLQENKVFIINCPISYIFSKFGSLGFINLKKKRPISNLKFITYEDKEIIKLFGAFSYSFLNWFRCSDNFSKIKFLLEVIRKSCFLTHCRKHNKRKTWAYSVYTPNLLINYKLYENKSFFPTRTLLISIKKIFLYNQIDFLCSENFFYYFKKLNK